MWWVTLAPLSPPPPYVTPVSTLPFGITVEAGVVVRWVSWLHFSLLQTENEARVYFSLWFKGSVHHGRRNELQLLSSAVLIQRSKLLLSCPSPFSRTPGLGAIPS